MPASPTWSGGSASFGITLVDAETETLTVSSDGTRSANFTPMVVNSGAASQLAWTNVTGVAGVPSECSGGCNYTGVGNGTTASATVSIIDSLGVVTNVGGGHTVVVTLGGSAKGSTTPGSPATLTILSSGPATTTGRSSTPAPVTAITPTR